MEQMRNLIGGQLVPPLSGKYLDNFNPATGKVWSHVPRSNHEDIANAVSAATKAQKEWSEISIDERAKFLFRIADVIDQNCEELAALESKDQGKPVGLALSVDIPRSGQNFRFFASAISQFSSEAHIDQQWVNYTRRDALGVVGCISPWNLPLYLLTWKIAPALAAGNCVIAKPSEITPATAYRFSELIQDVLPPGVLNIIHGRGDEAGEAMITHPEVQAISFTGGTATGAHIAQTAAPMFKKLSLELGGKNPNIIFADCDLKRAVSTSVKSSFANQGEICLCGSRIYVQKEIYEAFKNEFIAQVEQLKQGDPSDNQTQQGAIVSKPHYQKILNSIEKAKELGGKILCGGGPWEQGAKLGGWFIKPTVIEGLSVSCETNQDEIFGPVVTISPFETEPEAIKLANHSRYGLASSIWTQDLARAHRVSKAIKTGIVWVNCWMKRDLRTPFGGTKASGVGREGGLEALRFFTEPKNICLEIHE